MYEKCPACSHLLKQRYFDQTISRLCTTGCGGIWLTAADLENLTQRPGLIDRMLAATNFVYPQAQLRSRRCPDCHCELKTVLLQGEAEVEIDSCPQCHGIWLDKGEITSLSQLYRQARHQRQARSAHPVSPHTRGPVQTTLDLLETTCYVTEIGIRSAHLPVKAAANIAEVAAMTAGHVSEGSIIAAEGAASGAEAIGGLIEIILGLGS